MVLRWRKVRPDNRLPFTVDQISSSCVASSTLLPQTVPFLPKAMRILIYSYNYHPEPIGIAPLMTELAEGLVKRGHQVRVITGMPNYPERQIHPEYQGKLYQTEHRNGVTIQRSYVWIRPQLSLLTRILLDGSFVVTSTLQALRGWRPDVILLTVPPLPVSVPACLLGALYHCPVVVNLQDILPEAAVKLGILRNKFAIWLFEQLERFTYRACSAISVISDGFTDNLVRKGVSWRKIRCIPNWVDVNFIYPMGQRLENGINLQQRPNTYRQRHQLENKFVVLYAGNIALTQGLETVIRAARAFQDLPEIVFVIVGQANARRRLQRLCDEYGLTNVRLLNFEPRERLPHMLASADLGLVVQKRQVDSFNMPSKFQVLLASGCPVVASVPLDGVAAHAVIQSGGGVVVPPEDPTALATTIRALYMNNAKRRALGLQGRQYALQHYSLELALDRYEALFGELVARRSPNTVPDVSIRTKEVVSGR